MRPVSQACALPLLLRSLSFVARCCADTTAMLMQGVGNFTNVAVLLILLCICDVQTIAKQNAHPNRLGLVWRLAFGLGLIPITLIWLYRVFILRVRQWRRMSPCHLVLQTPPAAPHFLFFTRSDPACAGSACGRCNCVAGLIAARTNPSIPSHTVRCLRLTLSRCVCGTGVEDVAPPHRC